MLIENYSLVHATKALFFLLQLDTDVSKRLLTSYGCEKSTLGT